MKKFIFIMPLITISLLASCDNGGGDKPGPTEYTITYDYDGGQGAIEPSSYTIEDNVTLPTPTTLKIGYGEFDGWCFDEARTQSAGTGWNAGEQQGNKNLYAKYKNPISFQITYELNGGTSKGDNPDNYTIEDTITLNPATHQTLVFGGWCLKQDLTDNPITGWNPGDKTGKVTLYAKWTQEPAKTGTVIWENYDGTPLETDYNVSVGSTPTYDGNTPTREPDPSYAYEFSGWDPAIHDVVEGDQDNIYVAQYKKTVIAATIKIVIPDGSENLMFGFVMDSTVDFVVNWGDGVIEDKITHTYAEAGTYVISIYNEKCTYIMTTELGRDYVKEITLKDKITSVPNRAFVNCSNLTSINISENVTSIGGYAFNGCSNLNPIYIPKKVASIDANAFNGCSKLKVIYFDPTGDLTTIGEKAFYDCDELAAFTLPDNLLAIGNSAFANCESLASISIPDNVTSIGDSAFEGCSLLSKVDLTKFTTLDAESIPALGNDAFASCSNNLRFEVKNEDMANIFSSSNKGWPTDINKYTWQNLFA